MKKMFLIATAALFMFGCNNEKAKEETKTPDATAEANVTLPQKMLYDGSMTIGKADNIAAMMNFNADFIAGKLDNIGSYFADSIHLLFADGKEMNTVRDTAVAMIKAWRNSMDSAKQFYISAIAVDNKDKGHEWAMQWIDETHYYKGGKKEHVVLHEDYRMEKGKIRECYQYSRAVPEKK